MKIRIIHTRGYYDTYFEAVRELENDLFSC